MYQSWMQLKNRFLQFLFYTLLSTMKFHIFLHSILLLFSGDDYGFYVQLPYTHNRWIYVCCMYQPHFVAPHFRKNSITKFNFSYIPSVYTNIQGRILCTKIRKLYILGWKNLLLWFHRTEKKCTTRVCLFTLFPFFVSSFFLFKSVQSVKSRKMSRNSLCWKVILNNFCNNG